jgi:circadian clock protein KaiB
MSPRDATPKKSVTGSSTWHFCLYIAGENPRSLNALENLKRLCDEELPGRYEIEVLDIVSQPGLARTRNIVALPTLVRTKPEPIRRVIGDLSNREKFMAGMDVPISG